MSTFSALWTVLVVSILGMVAPAFAGDGFLGPSEYLCFDTASTTATGDCAGKDSPFKTGSFDYFHLDDVESASFAAPISVPGVTASADCQGRTVPSGNCPFVAHEAFRFALTDSVDEDDGAIDGSGQTTAGGGWSLWANGPTGIRFEFDPQTLGMLPTHAGIVWTDGADVTSFEAFDAAGSSLGTISGNHADGSFEGTTADDRFYGVVHLAGISAIEISNSRGGIEVDHLQFGKLSEPDGDGDGVPDSGDVCADTAIPESVPTVRLGTNRFALVDGDGVFDTTPPPGGGEGPGLTFTVEMTAGCACEQIIAALELGQGHRKHGCSISAMEAWVAFVNGP